MQPLTHNQLADNAYRTLGISASAGRSEIAAAARKLRIWSDPRRIPPTPWDFPALGPLARSRQAIDQAVARLEQPGLRIENRLLWYAALIPPADPGALLDVSPNATIAQRHDLALAALHAACATTTDGKEVDRWRTAIRLFAGLCQSPDFRNWQQALESAGDFEKRAADQEVLESIEKLPSAIVASMGVKAQGDFNNHRLDQCALIVSVIREECPARYAATELEQLFNGFEDSLGVLIRECDAALRDKLRTNHGNPQLYYAANRPATTNTANQLNARIEPAMTALCSMASDDSNRLTRIRTQCAALLDLIALGWEWSGEFITAEQTLLNALEMTLGSAGEAQIRKDLDRVRPLADQQRSIRALWAAGHQQLPSRHHADLQAAAIAGDLNQPDIHGNVATAKSGTRGQMNYQQNVVTANSRGRRAAGLGRSRANWGWGWVVALLAASGLFRTLFQSQSTTTQRPDPAQVFQSWANTIATQPAPEKPPEFNPDGDIRTPPGGPPPTDIVTTRPAPVGQVNREP